MFLQDSSYSSFFPPSSSLRDVTYNCGSCGYALNLSSGSRNTADIIATSYKYMKSITKGLISFFSIDETRFALSDELRCRPYFRSFSPRSWGLFRRRTRLLCHKCRACIGYVRGSRGAWNRVTGDSSYDIRIAALQPASEDVTIRQVPSSSRLDDACVPEGA